MNIKDSAKTILCFGDSNTWGDNPRTVKRHPRYPRSIRWPYVLQKLLGDEYEVISEGLCGRTLVAEDPVKKHRTGITHLQTILETVDPINLIIVMLGTNDTKNMYNLSARDIETHLEQVISLIKDERIRLEKKPGILIVCPPSPIASKNGGQMIREQEIFKTLPDLFKKSAEKFGCDFLNAGDYITSSDVDGIHLEPEAHQKLAEVISERIISSKIESVE